MMHVRGYHEYRGGVQYRGRYHEYHRGCSVLWGDIMSTVGVFSTMGGYHEYSGGVQYRGGYHEYRGGVQYRGGIS